MCAFVFLFIKKVFQTIYLYQTQLFFVIITHQKSNILVLIKYMCHSHLSCMSLFQWINYFSYFFFDKKTTFIILWSLFSRKIISCKEKNNLDSWNGEEKQETNDSLPSTTTRMHKPYASASKDPILKRLLNHHHPHALQRAQIFGPPSLHFPTDPRRFVRNSEAVTRCPASAHAPQQQLREPATRVFDQSHQRFRNRGRWWDQLFDRWFRVGFHAVRCG